MVSFAVLIVLLIFSGFFSATETALFSFSRPELVGFKNSQNPRHRLIYQLLRHPNQVLTSLLVGNNCINILFVLQASHIISDMGFIAGIQEKSLHLAILVEVALLTLVLLLVGEIFPKNFALHHAKSVAGISIYPFYFFNNLMVKLGVQKALALVNRNLLLAIRKIFGDREEFANSEDIKVAVDLGLKEGHLSREEASIIEKVLSMKTAPVEDFILNRSSVVSFSPDDSVQTALNLAAKNSETEYLVYDREKDSVVGIFNAEKAIINKAQGKVSDVMGPPRFVPYVNVFEWVLKIIGLSTNRIYAVVDEFGAYIGILSYQQIENFLVNNVVQPQSNSVPPEIQVQNPGWLVEGSLNLAILEDFLKCSFPKGDYHTVSGLLLNVTGKVLQKKDWVVVEGWKFYIESSKSNRIEKVLITQQGAQS